MSIASEITRLQNAKAALKTSINNKGGTITTELIDAYAPFVDSIATQKPEETKTIASPSFASGDIVVTPDSGRVLTSVTLSKDTTNHIADNIKSGVTLYGVGGSLSPAKEEETKTVSSPDFSSGNIVVTPTSGKVMTQVTINKDTTNHIAGNIKKDVLLYGVTGTYEGSGGASLVEGSPSIVSICFDGDSDLPFFIKQVKFYDNNVLKFTSNLIENSSYTSNRCAFIYDYIQRSHTIKIEVLCSSSSYSFEGYSFKIVDTLNSVKTALTVTKTDLTDNWVSFSAPIPNTVDYYDCSVLLISLDCNF